MDWQLVIVMIIVGLASYFTVKTLCFGNKGSKCQDCAVQCRPDCKTNSKTIIWLKKE